MDAPTRRQQKSVVTMRDVAQRAHVSQSTVSRVLSGAPNGIPIGEETKSRVLAAVKELGYYPNLYAGSLRGQKTQLLAMMVADIGNPFYHAMVRAVQDVARNHQYDVLIANTDHTRDGETSFMESLIRRPVDGVIMAPYHLNDDDIDRLMVRSGCAVAVVGQHIGHPQVDVAFGDDGRAVYETVMWLINQRGHERIAFIGVTDAFSAGARRHQAYEQAMTDAGLTVAPGYFCMGDWTPPGGAQAMTTLLALSQPPTAVFACNDLMAIGAIETALELGLRIPEDVAVVGFDDIPVATWVRPQLTTVAQYPAQMGERLATALFERISGAYSGPGRRYEVPCCLVVRESA